MNQEAATHIRILLVHIWHSFVHIFITIVLTQKPTKLMKTPNFLETLLGVISSNLFWAIEYHSIRKLISSKFDYNTSSVERSVLNIETKQKKKKKNVGLHAIIVYLGVIVTIKPFNYCKTR